MNAEELKKIIRDVPDFPKKGIIFKDITTLLKDRKAFKSAVDMMVDYYRGKDIDKVVGIESRGFIFASVVAYQLNAGFIPVRKPGKLPATVERMTYQLEYGEDTLEIHKDAVIPGERVVLIDDLIATGGSAQAVIKLIEKMGGIIVGAGFLVELEFLNGREKLNEYDVFTIIKY
ncbi:MAG: adenine phosphoribosyltransferase [Acidobacteriota bacterium]